MIKIFNKYVKQIKEETLIREQYLSKYYPFFKTIETMKFSKYKDYPISNIILALLSFLLYEGKLKEKNIFLTDISKFMKMFIEDAYSKILTDEEALTFSKDIIDKVSNQGIKFTYQYHNPIKNVLYNESIQYIKGSNDKKTGYDVYSITNIGIEFLLSTKEFGDESKISIYLLLIQKQLKNNNLNEIENRLISINAEIIKRIEEKQELIEILSYAPMDRFEEYLNYKEKALSILIEEEEMFKTIKNQISIYENDYLSNMSKEEKKKIENAPIMLERIKIELERNLTNHTRLINATIELSKEIPKIRTERMRRMFKSSLNFDNQANKIIKADDLSLFKYILEPLYKPNLKKIFNIEKISDMFSYVDKKIDTENNTVYSDKEIIGTVYTFEDEIVERIECNFVFYTKILLNLLFMSEDRKIYLRNFIDILNRLYGYAAIDHKDLMTYIFSLLPCEKEKQKFIYNYLIDKKDLNEIYRAYIQVIKDDESYMKFRDSEVVFTPVEGNDYIEIDNIMKIKNMIIEVI